MFGFLQKPKKESVIATLTIGSGSVRGALIKNSVTLSSADIVIQRDKIGKFDDLLEMTERAVSTVAEVLYESKVAIPDKIRCTLSSPWCMFETRTISMSRLESFTFTKKLADELLTKELSTIARTYEILENKVMEVIIDGQSYEEPIGVVGKSVKMNIVIAFSSPDFLNAIREKLSHIYSHTPVVFSSTALSSYLAVRNTYAHTSSYILLDLAGEITDLSVIENDIFKTSLSFPCGKNTLLRHIAKHLNKDHRDVDELFTLYTTNTLENKYRTMVAPAFSSAEELWTKSFLQSLQLIPKGVAVPDIIFLTADTDILPWSRGLIADRWNVVTLDKNNYA